MLLVKIGLVEAVNNTNVFALFLMHASMRSFHNAGVCLQRLPVQCSYTGKMVVEPPSLGGVVLLM